MERVATLAPEGRGLDSGRPMIRLLTFTLFLSLASARAGELLPENIWSRAPGPSDGPSRAIGFYSHGCLAGGIALPPDGAGYEAIRLERRRLFGHRDIVDFIQHLGGKAQAAGLPRFRVGDLAQARGGPLPYGHLSHQTGLDADIWFAFDTGPVPVSKIRDFPELGSVLDKTGQIDSRLFGPDQVRLLKMAVADPRVDRLFVNPAIKRALCRNYGGAVTDDTAWLHRVSPWWGHDDHFHVRLRCPADSPDCEPQKPVAPGDGCDADLESWGRPVAEPAKPAIAPPRPPPPPACRAVLRAYVD
ncbi:MAG: penicillin-insensitive murein DD-endopeptidase [Aliidongia sp.]|nr:penicillin-insensitive murein DD-endopeptidase [Aliidongia sp.]